MSSKALAQHASLSLKLASSATARCRFTHVFPQWKQRGFLVVAYDQRGFGKTALDTSGKRSKHSVYGKFSGAEQLADIDFFLRNAKGRAPEGTPLFLYGHSMVRAFIRLLRLVLTVHRAAARSSRSRRIPSPLRRDAKS